MTRHVRHRGWFSEGVQTISHDDGRVGRYSDGLANGAGSPGRVGHFSDGIGHAGGAEGRFSTGMERTVPVPEPRRIRPIETQSPGRRAA